MGSAMGLEYKEALAVRAKDEAVARAGQDGGAVTALLLAGLRKGLIDTAVVMYRDDEWRPKPGIARTEEEVIKAAGSKYAYMSLMAKLREAAAREDVKAIAYIGTPCQINALQALERAGKREIVDKVKLKVCLFCTHSWEWKSIKAMADELGIDLRDVVKMDVKGKLLFHLKDGSVKEYPLKKAEELARAGCGQCTDFYSSYADLAVGSIGSPEGWSTVLVLSDRGKEFLDAAIEAGLVETKPVEEKGLKLVEKFVERKRARKKEKAG